MEFLFVLCLVRRWTNFERFARYFICRVLVDFGRDVVTVFVAIVRAAVPPSAL